MEMKLKQSEYNFIYDDLGKDQIVMYNSFTGALAVVKEEQYRQFTAYLENGKEIEDKTFLDNLLKCGYLLPSGVDERFLIKTRMLQGRYRNDVLSLTIAPTMACNFRCVYCFEQGYYGTKLMDEETQKSVVNFVEKHVSKIKVLNITWYGGEPLLGLSVIENLSEKFLTLCKENNVQYTSCIVTNGYLLSKEVAKILKNNKVNFAQITIDGNKEVHDKRRPLLDGSGTYDVIMRNMIELDGILSVSLRINVDYKNINNVDSVVSYIKKYNMLKYVSPYLGLVIPYNENYMGERCLSSQVYSKYNLEFIIKNNLSTRMMYPNPKVNYCGADYMNSWVIDDKGYMYKCWNDIGISERRIGNINNSKNYIQSTDLLEKYSFFDPTVEKECKNCKMLPICLGGCPHNRLAGRKICEYKRFYMKDYLLKYTESVLRKKKESV